MLIRDMKAYLIGKYPGSAWAAKVKAMRDDEVIAIYNRKIKSAGQKPVVMHVPPKNQVAVYTCGDCFQIFASDNHELTECRFCGGHDLIREYKTVPIRKEI